MPSVTISFTEKAATAVKRGERGRVALILKDTNIPEQNPVVCLSNEDIPKTLSEKNKEQIKLALMGYVNAPKKVVAFVISEGTEAYGEALDFLKTIPFDYLAVPGAETDGVKQDIISYVKAQRQQKKLIKAVLPNAEADHEGIINYATEKVTADGKEYTAEEYCARIAGIIAGTPITISSTYAPLMELTDCTRLTKEEMDKAVDAGKFIVWHDGEKVKTARAVNSLVTTTVEKGDSFKKIKIVEAMDMISNDITKTAEDSYLGKYPNSYDNKCLLLSAIHSYLKQLMNDGVLSSEQVEINTGANMAYLEEHGIKTEDMDENALKMADTGSSVFLKAKMKIVDAIEDIVLPIKI